MAGFRVPAATYRLQFNRNFKFKAARELVPYLHDLGITDLYSSPLFRARRGSLHGYSVTNPMELNPELGSGAAFDTLARTLKSRGMGLVIDIVPNHMALSPDNPWWMDVLENGASSPYAIFFDIDWHHPRRVLDGVVLLPILGRHYGQALEAQELRLTLEEGGFYVRYYEQKFPLDPKTYSHILAHRLEALEKELGEASPVMIGLRGLIALIEHLPLRRFTSPAKVRQRQRDKEIIKKSLWLLYQGTPEVREFLDENVKIFNGRKGDRTSFDLLDRLLVEQPYRLAFWKVSLETINFRRFFSINDLIGIRIEDPQVFEAFNHGLLFRLIDEGKVTGIRADHIDGLYDPMEYLELLRNRLAAGATTPSGESGFYVVVEKILARDESLPEEFPASGTTGYDHLNMANGLFVEERGLRKLQSIYASLTGLGMEAGDVVYEKKKLVMETLFGGEVESLGHDLGLLASRDRHARDVSGRELTTAFVEVTACLPVYRTYIRSFTVPKRDLACLDGTIAEARRRNPSLDPPALDFLSRVLLLDFQDPLSGEEKEKRLHFVKRWQQFTGPVMAKGLEDTALYVYTPLVSLNEVGGSFRAVSQESFHRFNQARQSSRPFTMNAGSTHDTKRSEDVRARINTLSEIPEEWKDCLNRWRGFNGPKKIVVDGSAVPDSNQEIFLYQTLIGSWPLLPEEVPAYKIRLRDYLIKAAREAKVHTQWTVPNVEHENALITFLESILDDAGKNDFLEDFLKTQTRQAYYGAINSLSQVLLKIGSPGVPDFYQGTELWDFSLVDPDNRRPVDFQKRIRLLKGLKRQESRSLKTLIPELLSHWEDGRVKLYTTYKALNFRKEHQDLFLEGEYLPVSCSGARKANVLAFSRHRGDQWALIVVPRFTVKMVAPGEPPPGKKVWGESVLDLHHEAPASWTNVFTGDILNTSATSKPRVLPLRRIFSRFPVALLSGN